jgi:7-cyano-7-deazaguanine synthase in queuosine biosynthesis
MSKISEKLKQILNFLSGDIWNFVFTKRDEPMIQNSTVEMRDSSGFVSLLSGGLDSFIGAIDLLEENKIDTSFLSWYSSGKVTRPNQQAIKEKLKKQYKLTDNSFNEFHLSVDNSKEDTMRTRSFFLLVHSIALCYEKITIKNKVYVPENGFISVNPPISDARMGSSTTKTTHPFYIKSMNELIKQLGVNIEIENPYQFQTKGDMIENCKNQSFLSKNITNTVSCANPNSRDGSSIKHCGHCWPCIIRRSAIKNAGLSDDTTYRIMDLNRELLQSKFKPYRMFLKEIESISEEFFVLKTGPIDNHYIEYVEVIKKGVKEIKDFLDYKL